MEMIQINEFTEALVNTIQGRDVTRITHMFLLKDWEDNDTTKDQTFLNLLSLGKVIEYGIAAREQSMTVSGGFLATFSRVSPDSEITGIALIADGDLSINQTPSYSILTGYEKLAYLQKIEPLRKPEWEDLVIKVEMSDEVQQVSI